MKPAGLVRTVPTNATPPVRVVIIPMDYVRQVVTLVGRGHTVMKVWLYLNA